MKKVLVATPCLDQKVDAYFVDSLCRSIRLGLKKDIDIKCIFLSNESILPMARNELFNLAYTEHYDTVVFIDDDEHWNEECLIEIIESEKDVIAVPVVNKGDRKIEYNVYFDYKNPKIDPTDGYIEARSVGTGFLKLSRQVIEDLWQSSIELNFRSDRKLKMICEYTYFNGDFVGEDITLCRKIKELGYKIWVNPKYTVDHIGNKMYKGDFESSLKGTR